MGVSIQVNRCRIGTFAASTKSVHSKSSLSTCPASHSRWPGWAWSACLVLVLCALPLVVQHDLPSHMQYFPNSGTLSGSSWTSTWSAGNRCSSASACTPPWSLPPWPSSPYPAIAPYTTYCNQRLPSPTNHPMNRQYFTNFVFQLSKVELNFMARMKHGNRSQRGRGIKLLHWNKGPSF